MNPRFAKTVRAAISIAALLAAWQIASLFFPHYLFPPVQDVVVRTIKILFTWPEFLQVLQTAARIFAQRFSESLGQSVIVENRPGAAGAIANERVATSPPDGYNLLLMPASGAIVSALRSNLPYDLERDLAPISLIALQSFALVVHPSLPVRNVKELIALARARPRPVRKAEQTPSVALVVSAHNEEAVIRRRIENALALDYPADELEIVVASDGSTDLTDAIVGET